MFHLTKDIYLDYEENFDYQEDCIYISKHDIYRYNENIGKMLIAEFGEDSPKMYEHAQNITELLRKFDGDKEFFKFLTRHKGYLNNGKLYIYCEPYSYKLFVIKWWKTLLPHLKKTEAYKLFQLYKNRAIYAHRQHNLVKDNSEELHNKYWSLREEDFNFLYKNSSKFEIDREAIDNASLEFHLASYYCGLITNSFKQKVRYFYRKQLVDEIAETKKDLERRLYFLPKIIEAEKEINFSEIDIENIKVKYNFIGDSKIVPVTNTFPYLVKKYDILKLSELVLDAQVDLMYFHNRKELDPVSTFATQLYSDCGGEPTIKQILDLENKSPYYISIFFKMADHNKMNLFLLQEIFYLKEQGRTEELKRYCL